MLVGKKKVEMDCKGGCGNKDAKHAARGYCYPCYRGKYLKEWMRKYMRKYRKKTKRATKKVVHSNPLTT